VPSSQEGRAPGSAAPPPHRLSLEGRSSSLLRLVRLPPPAGQAAKGRTPCGYLWVAESICRSCSTAEGQVLQHFRSAAGWQRFRSHHTFVVDGAAARRATRVAGQRGVGRGALV
jgi:hypothetical protein